MMDEKYPISHLPVEEIDQLRLAAFKSNAPDDVLTYYKAASIYFQDHYVREMNHEIDREAARAEGYRAGVDAALSQIARLPTGKTFVEELGREDAYRAIEALLPKEPLTDGAPSSEPPRDRGKFLPPKDGAPCGGYGGKSQNGGE